MPFKDIELGFSRTAQFCGEQLECNLSVFGNMLAGNDNVGIDATAENEPGNQMAGFDMRWNSPIGNWPYAIYSQYIGEDESSYLPAKYLAQFGVEVWKPLADGGLVQGFAEYSHDHLFGEHQPRSVLQLRLQPGPVQRRRLSLPRPRDRPHRRSATRRTTRSAPPTRRADGAAVVGDRARRRVSIATATATRAIP